MTVLRINNEVFNLLLRMKTKAVIWQLFLSFQGLKSPNSSWNQFVLAVWLKSPSRQPIATKTTNYQVLTKSHYLLCAEASVISPFLRLRLDTASTLGSPASCIH